MPDLIPNLPYADYATLPGIRASSLMHMDRSPLHYQHSLRAPSRTSAALSFGTAVHCAVLEPAVFSRTYTTLRLDGRTKAGKEERKLAESNGLEVVTANDFDRIMGIQRAVFSRPDVMALLQGAQMEVSLTWEDERTGLACKGRVDVLGKDAIVDLKTSKDPSPSEFKWDSGRYDYHAKMAYYQGGVLRVTGMGLPVYLLTVESDAPHDVVLYEMPDEVLDVGRSKCQRLLDRVKECEAAGVWPGVAPGVVRLELPDRFVTAEEPELVMKETK